MVGPELTGVFAMQKGDSVAVYKTQEMYAFAATIDGDGQQHLDKHLYAMGLESVGVFEASGCDVFENRMRSVGKYVSGTVFQVGHGATHDISPRIVHDPQIRTAQDW